jgi:hypothetical protein
MLACAAAFLGIGAPAASAAAEAQPSYSYTTTFGKGKLSKAFRSRNSIAVDSTGKIFATDGNLGFTRVYSPDPVAGGVLLTSIDTNGPGFYADDVAVDPSTDVLYGQDVGISPSIRRFNSDGQPTPTYTLESGFELPPGEGFAIDPTTHDILVADPGAEGVRRYDTSGTLLETIPSPGMGPQRIAIAADGSIYLSQEGNPVVLHLSGAGALLAEIDTGEVQAMVVNADGDLVVAASGRLKTYSPGGQLRSEASSPTGGEISLAVDSASGRLYGYTGSSINVYDTATQPGADGLTVSDVTGHSVHVSAEADPGAPLPAGSEAHFEYSSDGGKTWQSTPSQVLSGPATVEADITGLLANFDYQMRFTASNDQASHTLEAVPFTTPSIAPELATGSATDISETSAVLTGTVNPDGNQTTWYFEYGVTSAYGSRSPEGSEAVAGNGRVSRGFSRTIAGLQPGTTYHFRIVAKNSIGVTEGADRTFTTKGLGETVIRGYEQVTPVDKQGVPLDPRIGFQVKDDGSAIAYINRNGKLGSPQYSFAMSRRGPTDWESGIDLSVPLNVTSATPVLDAQIVAGTTIAISSDFSHEFVATNRRLTPGAIEGGTNLYRVDVDSHSYDLVASSPSADGLIDFIAQSRGADTYSGGAPDFSWIVFRSEVPLVAGAPSNALYRWSEEEGLEVVSILPDGEASSVVATGTKHPVVRAVSVDGTRIYFAVASASEVGVFLHEVGKPTKAVSVSHIPGDPATPKGARILSASKSGRYLFFYSQFDKLTSDASGQLGDVYRYDASDESLRYLGAQTEAAQGILNQGDGSVGTIGVSDDGSTFYFRGPQEVTTKVWRDGVLATVTPDGLKGPWGYPSVSANGRYFAYEVGGNPPGPIYLYDADTGDTSCVTCLTDGSQGGGELPQSEHFVSNQIPRTVTDSGQVFYTTGARMVAADVNGKTDVYMYQDGGNSLISPGNGPFDAGFADVSADGSDVFFVTGQKLVGRDNDETPDIYDARIGGGLASQSPPPPQECLRDDCKATPGAGPELPFGGSEALSGPGNVAAGRHCGKGRKSRKVKGKIRCVKKHRANKKGKGGNR